MDKIKQVSKALRNIKGIDVHQDGRFIEIVVPTLRDARTKPTLDEGFGIRDEAAAALEKAGITYRHSGIGLFIE